MYHTACHKVKHCMLGADGFSTVVSGRQEVSQNICSCLYPKHKFCLSMDMTEMSGWRDRRGVEMRGENIKGDFLFFSLGSYP